MFKAFHHYKQSNQPLPDYFIIMDDDTYYNMELFQRNFEKLNSSEPLVVAGCLVRHPIHMINFTFPFGGFGSILSKGALHNLFRPIHCLKNNDGNGGAFANPDDGAICKRLSENLVGELRYFENGMCLVELIYAYVSAEKYRDIDHWKTGFCMHSDWVTGYFFNYYNVSRHVADPFYANVPHARIESYKGSVIYKKAAGFCQNENDCAEGSDICHYATADWMENEVKRWRAKMPDKFIERQLV